MSADLKAKVQQIYQEAFNKGNMDVVDQLTGADYVRHHPPMKDVKGLDAFKKFIADVRNAYTGFEIRVDEIIVEGDTSVARITLQGKHTGQTPTIQAAPTGNQVEMKGCIVSHWRGGKIVEDWVFNDYLGLLQQFGVYPPPGLY